LLSHVSWFILCIRMKNQLNTYSEKLGRIFSKIDTIIAAYFIGSFVRGEARRDSDLDIVIVLSRLSNFDYSSVYTTVSDVLPDYHIDLRVVIPSETSPLFLFQIVKEGLNIFERDHLSRVTFEAYTVKMYYDSQHARDIYNCYLNKRFADNSYGK